jgi:acyl carrier protein
LSCCARSRQCKAAAGRSPANAAVNGIELDKCCGSVPHSIAAAYVRGTAVAIPELQIADLPMTKTAFKKILEEILDVPPGSLAESDTRDTVAGWSSLTDVQILTAIWSELGDESEADAFEFETVGELLALLEARQAFSVY